MLSCQSDFAFFQQQRKHNNTNDDDNNNNSTTTTGTTKPLTTTESHNGGNEDADDDKRRNRLNVGASGDDPFQSSIASSVSLLSFGVHALEAVNRKQYPLAVLVVYVSVSVGHYLSTTSTPTSTTTTTRTTINTESCDGGDEDVDDEGDRRKFADGEVSCFLEGALGGEHGEIEQNS